MAIQVRRGSDIDFDAEKMLPGEIAVTTDGTRKAYVAFAPGDVKELASKEELQEIADGFEKSAAENIKEIVGDVNQLARDITYVENSKADAIVVSKEGTSIAITDSAKIKPQSIKTYGKSTQRTLAGTNLIDVTIIPTGTEFDSYIVSSDGYRVEVTTLADDTNVYTAAGRKFDESLTQYLAGKTIYLIADRITHSLSNAVSVVQIICTLDDNTRNYFNITPACLSQACAIPSNTVSIDFGIYTNNTNTPLEADNTVVVEGLRLTLVENAPWEPYVGGVASPNIEYPQEVESCGESGSVSIGVYSQNFFNANKLESTSSDLMISEDTYTITVVGGSNNSWARKEYYFDDELLKYFKGKSLYFAIDNITKSLEKAVTYASIHLIFSDKSDKYYELRGASVQFSVPKDTTKMRVILFAHNSAALLESDNVAVFKGVRITLAENLPWAPYTNEQSCTFQTPNGLRGIPLGTTIPDAIKNSPIHMSGVYWDSEESQYYIADTKNENGKDVQRIGHYDITGNENWLKSSIEVAGYSSFYCNNLVNNILEDLVKLCSHFRNGYNYEWNNGVEREFIQNPLGTGKKNVGIRVLTNRLTSDDASSFKALLREYNVSFSYILDTPIVTDISTEEKAQLDTLVMNYPNTTVINDANAHMDVEYVADTKKHIEQNYVPVNKYTALEERVSALEQLHV